MAPVKEPIDYFQRRVKPEFYETEEELGELPPGWEKATKGNTTYFVDHSTKQTTWIDPRTAKTREHDIMKIKEGELPYGWDEAMDDEIGVYYIDHNTQTTYLDPPWDENIKYQVSQLNKFLAEQQKRIEEMQKRVHEEEVKRVSDASQRVQNLELRRLQLEKELAELRSTSLTRSDSGSLSESDLLDDISDVEERIRLEKLMQGDTPTIIAEVEKFKERLKELQDMSKRLNNNTGVDEVAQAKAAQEEMVRLQKALDEEAAERKRLENEIMALKAEMHAMLGERVPIRNARQIPDMEPPKPARMTKYEMEMELLLLKKRIQAERDEKDRLKRMKMSMEDYKGSREQGSLPEWIRKIEEVASNSKTLRVKIGRKQAENPDVLSFRERMLFFASGAIDANIKGNAPPTPVAKVNPPSYAKPPKETAGLRR